MLVVMTPATCVLPQKLYYLGTLGLDYSSVTQNLIDIFSHSFYDYTGAKAILKCLPAASKFHWHLSIFYFKPMGEFRTQ